MDGSNAAEDIVSNPATAANRAVIIPGLLTVAPGKTQTVAGSGDDLSAWGNPALWQ
jgi:hypothetical protein